MHSLLTEALACWERSSDPLPELRRYSPSDQQAREAHLDRFSEAIQAEFRKIPRTRTDRQNANARITEAFAAFARAALDLEDRHLTLLLEGGFSGIGSQLGRMARQFDPSVGTGAILQAARNAWAACGLQLLFGKPMCLSPAIFAYSMLYPYSDNNLDDMSVSREAKLAFSARFGNRLEGHAAQPSTPLEVTIWRLVEQIELQYPRAAFPQVHAALLAIHRAQEQSVALLRGRLPLPEDAIRSVVFQKGGASVLADAYLAAGTLAEAEARFAFDWGVFLQLADDLQDVQEDRAGGLQTLFSSEAGRCPLDALTTRTFAFGRRVMARMAGLAEGPQPLKDLLDKSSHSLLVRGVGEASEFYTAAYVAELETYSPFGFNFLKARKERMSRRGGSLAMLFEAFLSGEPDEPVFPFLPSFLTPR